MEQTYEYKITCTQRDTPDYFTLEVWERAVMGDAVTDWKPIAKGGVSTQGFPGHSRTALRAAVRSVFH